MHLVSRYANAKFSPAIRDVRNNPCPVSTLPIELLQEIFAFSMTKKPDPPIRAGVSRNELEPPGFQATALILTWVCSQWRQISLSMPGLWGTMIIYNPTRSCVELTKVYLSRSGTATSLNLYLRQDATPDYWVYPNPETCPEHRATVEIFKLWVPQAHRWRSIFLDLSYTPPSYELPKIPADALCSLQEADLHFREQPRHSDAVIKGLWANIFRSPALRTAYGHDLDSKHPAAPFTQLFEFGPFFPTADEFMTLLPSFHRLRRLSVDRFKASHNTTSTLLESVVILPFLEYLDLDIRQESSGILEQLSAPVLRELRITDTRDTPFAEVHSLGQFLERSRCNLRCLHLAQERMEDEMPLIGYFSRASHLLVGLETCSLTIYDTAFSERVISLFTPKIVDDTLLVPFPCLVDLQLRKCVTKDGVISSMLESRSAAGSPLWAFVCKVLYGPSNSTGYPQDEAVMQRLLQDGLQLYWTLLD
ncbi:hypothetical protein BDN72DRAFT_966139 [Pluteus cervinus]|uniref:Uncharacterized protein n=1 Tax=Pluteus cervinus TaxID=181527 RepID=A0ACD3A0H6_9AGAR|nr:hypothetical protein BDN72DRAFT_966139 [Pluteus cervinus]